MKKGKKCNSASSSSRIDTERGKQSKKNTPCKIICIHFADESLVNSFWIWQRRSYLHRTKPLENSGAFSFRLLITNAERDKPQKDILFMAEKHFFPFFFQRFASIKTYFNVKNSIAQKRPEYGFWPNLRITIQMNIDDKRRISLLISLPASATTHQPNDKLLWAASILLRNPIPSRYVVLNFILATNELFSDGR